MTYKRAPKESAGEPSSRSSDGIGRIVSRAGGPPDATPAGECAEARPGSGVETPVVEGAAPANHLDRSFVFVDISGFTSYVDKHGEHAALAVLTRFRSVVRDIVARRGVRVGKWLGDGVMLVGIDPDVAAAAAAEMLCRFPGDGIDIHAGLASGPVLLFEGDDYVGRPVNLAARLCAAAGPGELLAVIEPEHLPSWVHSVGELTVQVAGVGDVTDVRQLAVDPAVLAAFTEGTSAA